MIWTAEQENIGGSLNLGTTNGSVTLPMPFLPGGVRLVWSQTTSGLTLTLPPAVTSLYGDQLTPGGLPFYRIVNTGSASVTVRDASLNTVVVITANTVARIFLASTSVDPLGSWVASTRSTSVSTSLSPAEVFDVSIIGPISTPFNLRYHLDSYRRYTGKTRAICRVSIGDGTQRGQTTLGSNDSTTPAFSSGSFPAGSKLVLVVRPYGRIHGRGGDGGGGATPTPGLLATSGQDGGTAVQTEIDMVVINWGGIRGGGGGGGGGGNASSTQGGGGGGGGAGYATSAGGYGGGGGGQPGSSGTWVRGSGGTSPVGAGGNGGGFGIAGAAGTSGGSGGAAGNAIENKTGTTVTKLRAGDIVGSEVTF